MSSAPLFGFNQGDHCCIFYEDESALLEILIPYLAEGLKKRERCFTAQAESFAGRLVSELKRSGIDADAEIASGALTVVTLEQFYGNDAKSFHPYTLMSRLLTFVDESIALGYTGTRTAGEMQFIMRNGIPCNYLMEYERMVDAAFPGKHVLGICQYNTRLLAPEVLQQALAAHRQSVSNLPGSTDHCSMSIRHDRFLLDITAHRERRSKNFYYVAQEHDKREILGWGVAHNFDDAVDRGESLLYTRSKSGRTNSMS